MCVIGSPVQAHIGVILHSYFESSFLLLRLVSWARGTLGRRRRPVAIQNCACPFEVGGHLRLSRDLGEPFSYAPLDHLG